MPGDGRGGKDTKRQSACKLEEVRSEDVVDAERDAQVPGLQDLSLSSRACKIVQNRQKRLMRIRWFDSLYFFL